MIEKHYGRYINSDAEEQLKRVFEGQKGTFAGTLAEESDAEETQVVKRLGKKEMVGASGFEPPTSRSRTVRSTKLSHAPTRTT